ncbi:hypothetical protein [Winogradskyella sp. 3972H.M.0a.05]|uniref:chorismate transformation enzyme, FkbO/Hyg5 family n=1 Tax=Winogradskyella sp. 3972H.M.0a.05 TaxID=2950277 RepID=UPI003394915F
MGDILEIAKNIFFIIWPMILTSLMCIAIYIFIKNKYIEKFNRFEREYIFSPWKLKKYTGQISLFYAILISGISFNSFFYLNNPKNLKLFAWIEENFIVHLAIFFTLQLGIWGLIVSYNVLRQQKSQIVSFDEFLLELTDTLQRLIKKAELNSDKTFYIYLYDYHPLIGNFSAHKRYKEYKAVVDKTFDIKNINVTLITNHQDTLPNFFKKLSIDEDYKIVKNSFEAINYIKEFEQDNKITVDRESNNSIIWKSSNVSENHFILIHDIAYQYVVLPQESGVNNIFGIKSEDPFIINYLEKSFFEKLKGVISPTGIHSKGEILTFCFEPQSSIEKIVLFDNEGNRLKETNDLIPYNDIDTKGFLINKNYLTSFPFYYEVKKKHINQSVKSRRIFYREILSAIEGVRKVKYILPNGIPNNRQIEYCFDQLSELIGNKKILLINIFFDKNYFRLDSLIEKFGNITNKIPTNYIPQVPEMSISIEVIFLSPEYSHSNIIYHDLHNYRVSEVVIDEIHEYFLSSKENFIGIDLQSKIETTFQDLCKVLEKLGLDYKEIFRQWNYIGDINHSSFQDGSEVDNYNVFCGVRQEVFENLNLQKENYPAATGVGVQIQNYFSLSAFAMKGIPDDKITNLRISTQNDPFTYTQQVTKGPNKPLFHRGKSIATDKEGGYTFISGTSSIKEEQSHKEDNIIFSQTNVTIESIYDLLKTNNERIISLRNMSYIRIYYTGKEQHDLEIIKTFLSPIIKDVPHIYLRTDICRKNLQIEIEAARF